MKYYSQLFDSSWRDRKDTQSQSRQARHFESMAEQVMANRNEIMFLQGELNRVSHDLAQAMTLNRSLVKLILREKGYKAESLERMLEETIQEHTPDMDPESVPSNFCEDCGRPLPQPGQICPYCSELKLETEQAKPSKAKSKKRKSKKKKPKKPTESKDEPNK